MSKNKVQWLDLTSHLWPTLVGLPLTRTIGVYYEIIIKYSELYLTFSTNYSWFMQYMKNDNGESGITQLPLGMNYFYTWGKLIYCVFIFTFGFYLFIQLLNFACSWFKLLFMDYVIMFINPKGRKQLAFYFKRVAM